MTETNHERWSEDVAAYMLGALGARRGGGAGAPRRGLRALPGGDALADAGGADALPEGVERRRAAARSCGRG